MNPGTGGVCFAPSRATPAGTRTMDGPRSERVTSSDAPTHATRRSATIGGTILHFDPESPPSWINAPGSPLS